MAEPPFKDLVDLEETAEEKWRECIELDWLEAFQHHPKIGDINSLKKKFASTAHLASNEQSSVNIASEKILEELAKGNEAYEKKFGYIFIVCATGKSAEEMLNILRSRLPNSAADEIEIAAEEQIKITKLRLEKLFV
ncbi:MAG: uraD [Segetibacter sp.]|nr:uraD [Segetibacter sp.]